MQAKRTPRRTAVKGKAGVYYRPCGDGRVRPPYEFWYHDSEGIRRWKTFDGSLVEAVAARAELAGKVRKGERVIGRSVRFAEYADEWLDAQTQLRPHTLDGYKAATRLRLKPTFGRLRLTEITPQHIRALIARMHADGYAGWTIHGTLVPLSAMLAQAAYDGLIPDNPIRKLQRKHRPRVVTRPKRILMLDEIDSLLKAGGRYAPIFGTAIFAGLRLGEVLGLSWPAVDLSDGKLRVAQQLDRRGELVEPKTQQATRDVLLHPRLLRMLRELPTRFSGGLVFTTRRGTPFGHRNILRALDYAAERAKITGEPKLTFHDLRHTFASAYIKVVEGNVAEVQRALGHAKPDITLRVYVHEFEALTDDVEARRRRLERAFR